MKKIILTLFLSSISAQSKYPADSLLKSENISGMMMEEEYIKRMKSMNQFMQSNNSPVFDDSSLVVNTNSPLVKNILDYSSQGTKSEQVTELCHYVYDLARMSKQQLSGEQMEAFVARANRLMSELSNK